MYYVAYEKKDSKQKRWKVFANKQEVFDFFKTKAPKRIPDSYELSDLNESIGDNWEISKLTSSSRKKLEEYYDKKGNELEGKGDYFPELIEKI